MKKVLALLLSLTMTAAKLAGCGSSSSGAAEAEPEAEAEETTEEAEPAEEAEEAEPAEEAEAGGIQVAAEDLKVALILPGNINDQGWCTTAYMGLQEIADTFGCETHYSEFVELSEYEARIRSYGFAFEGKKVLIADGAAK